MKKEGDRKICGECKVEIICKRITDTAGERLSWRNVDGSPHFAFDDETKSFIHTPTINTERDIWREEIEERLARLEHDAGIVRVVE